MAEFNTLEDARAEIVRLGEELTKATTERDTLSQNNNTLQQELENVKKINQQYFNRLTQQVLAPEKDEDPEPEPTSYEELAKLINI